MSRRRAQHEEASGRQRPTHNPWPAEYVRTPNSYIWGTEPSLLARELAEMLPPGARVLDLGCGEGRDSVFFAARGFDVTGLDTSPAGLEKAQRLAAAHGVFVRWVRAALPQIPAAGPFDLVYSCGSIHYVPRRKRRRLCQHMHALTAPGGWHAHVVFTDALIYREMGEVIDYFHPGELAESYVDWAIIRREEGLIACDRDGTRHVHSVDVVIAQNMRSQGGPPAASREEAWQWIDSGWRQPRPSSSS